MQRPPRRNNTKRKSLVIIEHVQFYVKRPYCGVTLAAAMTRDRHDGFLWLRFAPARFTSLTIAAKGNRIAIQERNRLSSARRRILSELIQQKVSGLRERNKLDKLRRIKKAASELFVLKGFDDTTTREIAIRAGVGLGTVFVYATTKRDLLFLLINDDLQRVVEQAATLTEPAESMLENLLRVFKAHYLYFKRQPELSRLGLREMSFYAGGPEAQKFLKTRQRLIALIKGAIDTAIDRKAISPKANSSLIADVVFSIYQVEVRRWLSLDELNVTHGLKRLRQQLVLLVDGLSPRDGR